MCWTVAASGAATDEEGFDIVSAAVWHSCADNVGVTGTPKDAYAHGRKSPARMIRTPSRVDSGDGGPGGKVQGSPPVRGSIDPLSHVSAT